jgi:hypothetical protein
VAADSTTKEMGLRSDTSGGLTRGHSFLVIDSGNVHFSMHSYDFSLGSQRPYWQ